MAKESASTPTKPKSTWHGPTLAHAFVHTAVRRQRTLPTPFDKNPEQAGGQPNDYRTHNLRTIKPNLLLEIRSDRKA